jgi:hypothetical protein
MIPGSEAPLMGHRGDIAQALVPPQRPRLRCRPSPAKPGQLELRCVHHAVEARRGGRLKGLRTADQSDDDRTAVEAGSSRRRAQGRPTSMSRLLAGAFDRLRIHPLADVAARASDVEWSTSCACRSLPALRLSLVKRGSVGHPWVAGDR